MRRFRPDDITSIEHLFTTFPVVALVGPRQAGKTTLARILADRAGIPPENIFDLESPEHFVRLENAEAVLRELRGLVILDEIQLRPDLFPILRVLADRDHRPARFLILGSAAPELIRGASETMAGRVATLELGGFGVMDIEPEEMSRLWVRGGFPRSFLADDDEASFLWRQQFMQSFLFRDLANMGIDVPPFQMRRLWLMLAHYHAQTWNSAGIAGQLGLSDKTVRRYLDILTGTFLVRQLLPWTENAGKRVRKAPKIYIRDSGLFHSLLDLRNEEALRGHAKLGASWEGAALEQTVRLLGAASDEVFYWATHSGAEIDLMLFRRGQRIGFAFKFTDSPRLTKSMMVAKKDLKLDRVTVVYPGQESIPLAEGVDAVPLGRLRSVTDFYRSGPALKHAAPTVTAHL